MYTYHHVTLSLLCLSIYTTANDQTDWRPKDRLKQRVETMAEAMEAMEVMTAVQWLQ